jgi:histidinol-phosphatase (PHP family)
LRFDQHLHSKHSFDCETEPEQNVLRAMDLNLAGLTFTEHFDTHPDEWPTCRYDDARYSQDIARLRETYGHRLFIGKGIEVCYQPQRMDFILDHLDKHEFDLVMLSVHWVGGRTFHHREDWDGLDPATGTRLYFQGVLDAARCALRLREQRGRVFDVLGHLDLVRRYTHRFFDYYHAEDSMDIVEEIFRTCLAADLIPEVNTSTVRVGAGWSMPDALVVARYAALGGRAMCLGSDAHRADHISADFDYAVDMLQANGITYQAVFRQRHPLELEVR